MTLTFVFLGLYAAIISMLAGWFAGARVGDTNGIIGYALGALALAAGISAAAGW